MLLKNGSIGDDVKRIQERLRVKADGIFGPGTAKAVKDWQAANCLKADGIVGQITWNKMFSDDTTASEDLATPEELKLDKLVGHIPGVVVGQITDCATKFNINTALRLSHFLAQCGHESLGFTLREENLNYSADGLKKTFPKYFYDNLADSYARQPEKIASRVYANRMGNGDENSKEGYKYRGRGYIQLTGKDNYKAFDNFVDDDIMDDPDLVLEKYALLSAAWFWNYRSINATADIGSTDEVVKKVTILVNGGTKGLDDRTNRFNMYFDLLT